MTESSTQIDWEKILLQPQPDWYRKECPVVEETILDENGKELVKKLARVSPAIEPLSEFPPHRQVGGYRVVALDYEVLENNVNAHTPRVEVEVLQAGGWKDDLAKQTHILEFKGFTTDKDKSDKRWSFTF